MTAVVFYACNIGFSMFCISWEVGGQWPEVVVEVFLLCSQGHFRIVKIVLFIFSIFSEPQQVLRLCHGLGIRSCRNICLSRPLPCQHIYLFQAGHFLLRDESDVYSWMSAFSAWITEHAISPGISCHILTRPIFNQKYYRNITEILQKYYKNITEILQKYYRNITEHAISPCISCHILTRPTFNLFFIKNMPIVAHHCRNIK